MSTKSVPEMRAAAVARLHDDLVGPMNPEIRDEVLADYPTDKYLTGILFPRESTIPQEEDDELASADGDDNDNASDDGSVPLSSCIRPASAGLSFLAWSEGAPPEITVTVSAGRYRRRWLSADGKSLTETPRTGRRFVRWQREEPAPATVPVKLDFTEPKRWPLGPKGFPGLELYVQTSRVGAAIAVTAVMINTARHAEDREANEEAAWFQTRLRVTPSAGSSLHGRAIRKSGSAPDDQTAELIYRSAVEYAVGHTCAASWETDGKGGAASASTEWIPTRVILPVSFDGDPVFDGLRNHSRFSPFSARWLADSGKKEVLDALRLLPAAYESWATDRGKEFATLDARLRTYAERHERLWAEGAQRMKSALDLLGRDPAALRAFQLANRAMAEQRRWSHGSDDLTWRPFQLAFQLLVAESVLNPAHADRDLMDLLWFPTGGGKTEAYLAIIAMVLLHRRLRPQDQRDGAGVAVIMRYTLRVLTTQQFERAAKLVLACEYLRTSSEKALGKEPFSIGLWVGGTAIPNRIEDAHDDAEQRAFQVRDCPACREKLALGPSRTAYEVFCRNPACHFGSRKDPLPLWTVDDDVYRVLPSVLIGTIDKFAQIARREETGRFFGLATTHAAPDLIIQDELHLISGPLGTIAGLYETAIDAFCTQSSGRPPKIVGSTATIRMADVQVKHLFNRRLYQFPPPGVDASNSCFAVSETDVSKGRLYAGVTTAGRSAKFTLQAVCASMLQSAASPGVVGDDLDAYRTLVTYFNSLRELGAAHVLMLDDVPKSISEYASRRSEKPRLDHVDLVELTSRLSQAEIPVVLKQLQEGKPPPDVLLSTNMISVGVDISRLALMIVTGQPKSISEYIQATSRVGRDRVPGLVLTTFNSGKPRDRSHFETFTTWHGTLYRDVEANSVTPFAARSIDKAARAVVVALARHLVPAMRSNPKLDPARRIDVEKLAEIVIRRVTDIDLPEKTEVERKLTIILDEWEKREGVRHYWREDLPQETLLMSAETIATYRAAKRPHADVWSAPNSMRDVEPATTFQLLD